MSTVSGADHGPSPRWPCPRRRGIVQGLFVLGMIAVVAVAAEDEVPEPPPVAVEPQQFQEQPVEIPPIEDFTVEPPPPVTPPMTEIAPGSSGIVVHGVVTVTGRGYALISANGKPQDMYAVGREISPGVQLFAVYPDRVILERGGRHEILRLQGAGRYVDEAPAKP